MSTLDMRYLTRLPPGYEIMKKDVAKGVARGIYSLYDNNVVKLFDQQGYSIYNYTINDFRGHPSKGIKLFDDFPGSLVRYRELSGRVMSDVGWNFSKFFAIKKDKADAQLFSAELKNLDKDYDGLIMQSLGVIKSKAKESQPGFFMFHFMLPHEPYFYDASGNVLPDDKVKNSPENYIEQVKYTNIVISKMVDRILSDYANKNIVIVVQGDHGYKFDESSAINNAEKCQNFYAVYCSDKNYSTWYRGISSVNGFRILFNKYFKTNFPILPDSSTVLYYR
jgi:phosphoglycerol transferase MdoB-like AlkP superfamily enzyme